MYPWSMAGQQEILSFLRAPVAKGAGMPLRAPLRARAMPLRARCALTERLQNPTRIEFQKMAFMISILIILFQIMMSLV